MTRTLALLALLATPTLAQSPPFPPDIQAIKDRGQLVVLQFHGQRAGFFMPDDQLLWNDFPSHTADDRRWVGYDVEIASHLAHTLGVDLTIDRSPTTFDDVLLQLARGHGDLALGKLTVTPQRAQFVRFSTPYLHLHVGLMVDRFAEQRTRRGPDLTDLCNHPDATIAVQAGTSWETLAHTRFPRAHVLPCPDLDATFDALRNGDALAVLDDEWNFKSLLRGNPELAVQYRIAFLPHTHSAVSVAAPSSSTHLLAFVDTALDALQLRTTPDALLDRYFPESREQLANSLALAERPTHDDQGVPPASLAFGLALLSLTLSAWVHLARSKRTPPNQHHGPPETPTP